MNQSTNPRKPGASQRPKERNPWSEPEPEPELQPRAAGRQRWASLSSSFIIMAMLAVMAGMAAPAVAEIATLPPDRVQPAVFLFGLLGLLIGLGAGVCHLRSLMGLVWGAPTGFLLGIYTGILGYTPVDGIERAVLPACLGSVVVVGLAAVIRLARGDDRSNGSDPGSPFDEPPGSGSAGD